MRKLLLTLCVLAATQFTTFAQGQKIGHINVQQLMLEMPERATAEAQLKKEAEKLDALLKNMGSEYQTKLASAQQNEATMSDTEKEVILSELADLEERITKAQRKAQEDIAKREQELLDPMLKRAQEAINVVAKENGFSYIMDVSSGMIPYYEGGNDVTDLVKAQLTKTANTAAPVGQ